METQTQIIAQQSTALKQQVSELDAMIKTLEDKYDKLHHDLESIHLSNSTLTNFCNTLLECNNLSISQFCEQSNEYNQQLTETKHLILNILSPTITHTSYSNNTSDSTQNSFNKPPQLNLASSKPVIHDPGLLHSPGTAILTSH